MGLSRYSTPVSLAGAEGSAQLCHDAIVTPLDTGGCGRRRRSWQIAAARRLAENQCKLETKESAVAGLTVRHEGSLWTCVCEERKLESVGFVDLIMLIKQELRVRQFSVEFDCEGKAIDGVIASFDFGAPDTYIPD
jgi:hypothetical protein